MSRIPQSTAARRDRRKAPRASRCIEHWYYRLASMTFAADPSVVVGSHDTGKSAALRRLCAILEARDASEHLSESGLARISDSNPATEQPSS